MRYSLPIVAAAGILAFTAVPSFANRAAADKCAARLSSDAKLVYTATVSSVKPGADLKDIVRSKTRGLVMAGQLNRGKARNAAMAAGNCLKLAR
jgi:hypothetical protein